MPASVLMRLFYPILEADADLGRAGYPGRRDIAAVFGPAPATGEDPAVGMEPKQPATAQA